MEVPMAQDPATAPSDAALIRAARDDPHAFRLLYDRYAGRVHGFHLRRTRDADASHDLTAETFAQAWLSRRRFRDEAHGSASPWLFAIARNVLVSSVRRGALEDEAQRKLGLLDRAAAAHHAPDEHWLDDTGELLDTLPEGQGDAVRLRVIDDLTYDDVADTLGITPQAARVRVHRGLATLRSTLAPTEDAR
jgi:RNA polymerase sigma-70 factor (ECF subfamily)